MLRVKNLSKSKPILKRSYIEKGRMSWTSLQCDISTMKSLLRSMNNNEVNRYDVTPYVESEFFLFETKGGKLKPFGTHTHTLDSCKIL